MCKIFREKESRLQGPQVAGRPETPPGDKKLLKYVLAVITLLCITALGFRFLMTPKDDSSVKLTPALEIDDSSNAGISKIGNRKNNLSYTEEPVALDDSDENHDSNSQEPDNKSEKFKETISVAPSPIKTITEGPKSTEVQKDEKEIPNLNQSARVEGNTERLDRVEEFSEPPWTLTFLAVDENQGDSVSVSYLNNDEKTTSVSPTKKDQRWEFMVPAYISTVDVEYTKAGESRWTSIPKRISNNTYNFQELVQMLLQ